MYIVETIAGGAFLWLGLYLFTRELPVQRTSPYWWRRPALLASLAMVLTSIFLFGTAIQSITTTMTEFVLWQKLTWWPVPFAVALWLWVILLIVKDGGTKPPSVLSEWVFPLVVLAYGATLSVVGTFSEVLFRYEEVRSQESSFAYFFVPPRVPAHYFYGVYVVITLLTASVLLLRLYIRTGDKHRRQGIKWLSLGSLIITVGAALAVVGYSWSEGRLPEQVGDLVITLGLGFTGYGVLNHNALLSNRVIQADFKRSLLGVTAVVIFYIGAFGLAHWLIGAEWSPLGFPLLTALLVMTHTPLFLERWLLDKLTLPEWQARYNRQLTQLIQDLRTAPDKEQTLLEAQERIVAEIVPAAIEGVIEAEVESIFRNKNFSDPKKDELLARSNLQHLKIVKKEENEYLKNRRLTTDLLSTADRAAILRLCLTHIIDNEICPKPGTGFTNHEAHAPVLKEQWAMYAVLRKQYVEGWRQRDVREFLSDHLNYPVPEGAAYNRLQQMARSKLATTIRQLEMRPHAETSLDPTQYTDQLIKPHATAPRQQPHSL